MRESGLRVLVALLVAAGALGLGPAVTPATVPTVQASQHQGPDLTMVTDARYQVDPDAKLIHITVAITATNHLVDTATRRLYFDRAFLAVLPGTSGFRITGATGTPKVTVTAQEADHTLLRIDFGSRLAAGKSTTFMLDFDLVDPGGAGNRDVRVGTTVVSFPLWAFGTDATPGSRVRLVLPPDYAVEFLSGGIPGPEVGPDGLAVYDSGALAEPLAFYAYVVADRPGAYVSTPIAVPVADTEAAFVIEAWEDDPDWGTRVADLFGQGLPVLGRIIGLPWPEEDPIRVREALSRTTGGYAGLFDPAEGRIDVAYYAGPGVVLHEAAHGWFNGALLADRWANEAFASYYGSVTAQELGLDLRDPELTEELNAHRIPLNDWGPLGDATADVESYAYAASLEVARRIAERAGDGALREVWAKASARVGAYQPVGGDGSTATAAGNELVDAPPDWRGLLDLLEDTTGSPFEDLWSTWIIRGSDRPLLADRAAARTRYAEVVDAGGDWRLPPIVRDALRAWQFDMVDGLLDGASEVVELRARIAAEAASAGLSVPGTLRPLFETRDSFDAAINEANAQLEVLEVLETAGKSRIVGPGIVETLGLIGTEPERDMAAARAAYERGDLRMAVDLAARAQLAWVTAEEVGGGRAMSLLLFVLAVTIIIVLIVRSRRRARARSAVMQAHRDEAAAPHGD